MAEAGLTREEFKNKKNAVALEGVRGAAIVSLRGGEEWVGAKLHTARLCGERLKKFIWVAKETAAALVYSMLKPLQIWDYQRELSVCCG